MPSDVSISGQDRPVQNVIDFNLPIVSNNDASHWDIFMQQDSDNESNDHSEIEADIVNFSEFLDDMKSINKDSKVKCLCGSTLYNKKGFSKHKSICSKIKYYQKLYSEKIFEYLPNECVFDDNTNVYSFDGSFDTFFEKLNSQSHKYIKFTTRNDSKTNIVYKTLKCHASSEKNCKFTIQIKIRNDDDKICISTQGYHNHFGL